MGVASHASPACERISGRPARSFWRTPTFSCDIIVPEDRKIWDDHQRNTVKRRTPMGFSFAC